MTGHFQGPVYFQVESRAPFNGRWNLRSATEGIRSIYNKGKLMVIKGRKYHDQGDGFAELERFLIRAKIDLNGR